jgi:hypothetical protein
MKLLEYRAIRGMDTIGHLCIEGRQKDQVGLGYY